VQWIVDTRVWNFVSFDPDFIVNKVGVWLDVQLWQIRRVSQIRKERTCALLEPPLIMVLKEMPVSSNCRK